MTAGGQLLIHGSPAPSERRVAFRPMPDGQGGADDHDRRDASPKGDDHGTDDERGRDGTDGESGKDGQDGKDGNGGGEQDDDKKDGDEKQDGDDGDGKGGKKGKLPLIVLAVALVVVAVGAFLWWFAHRNLQSTDDAYTEGNAISIAPKVAGYVVLDRIDDNVAVRAGDLLVRIDPRDYLAARDQAQANLDAALAQEAGAANDLAIVRVRAPADLVQAQAQLQQASASRDQAARDFDRQHAVDPRATTQTVVDQTTTSLRTGQANVRSARAQVATASLVPQNVRMAEATLRQRAAEVEQARAALALAQLNLGYTEIRAPVDGRITQRNVNLGTYLPVGQQIFYLVSHDQWITANFKETQLKRMRVGQRVDVAVDAYPQLKLEGHIESIQGGSGARFTAFPAENATGNFVKIVRRVPVKVVIDRGLPQGELLPLGLSVEPTVHLP